MISFVIHDAFVSMVGTVFATADTIKNPTGKILMIDGEQIRALAYDSSISIWNQKNHFVVVGTTKLNLQDYIGKISTVVEP